MLTEKEIQDIIDRHVYVEHNHWDGWYVEGLAEAGKAVKEALEAND